MPKKSKGRGSKSKLAKSPTAFLKDGIQCFKEGAFPAALQAYNAGLDALAVLDADIEPVLEEEMDLDAAESRGADISLRNQLHLDRAGAHWQHHH